jgi:hypothetical protein
LLGAQLRAEDLFLITARTTTGTPQALRVGSNNLPDLVTNLIKSEQEFIPLQNRDVSAVLRYAGIDNAITIRKNANNTSATVDIPSTGLHKTFTAANENDLKNQIIDYVKKNGAAEYAKFLRVINRQSDAGVTDGNPLAATALLADHQYEVFGLQAAPFPLGATTDPLDRVSTPRFRFDVSGGAARTDQGDGYFVSGAIDVGFRFADRVGLVFSTPFAYRTIEGANIYTTGEEIAVPIGILPPTGDRSLSWTVTPAGMLGAAGSLELAAGGTFAGGGITSSLSYQLGSTTLTLADHYSYFHGYPIDFGNFRFDTNLEQQVLKNGLKVTQSFGRSAFVDASITYTSLLNPAATTYYWTPAAGVGVRFGAHAGLRVGYQGDFAHGYTVHGGILQLYFNY